jgi:sarcosine oxidase subunit gamma
MAEWHLNHRAATAGRSLPALRGVFEVTEIDNVSRYILRGGEPAIAALSSALGVALEQPINQVSTSEVCSALHVGPNEWLLLVELNRSQDFISRLRNAAGDRPYALVDVSHRNVGLHLHGSGVGDALASGCPQNLDDAAFPIGKCTRTVYAKTGIFLWRRDENDFVLETWRSFVPYLLDYLTQETALLFADRT